MNYFKQLKTGDKTFSIEHGVVEVLLVEERDQTLFVTCQTPGECDSEQTTFDAIEGELRAPTWVDELPHLNALLCRLHAGRCRSNGGKQCQSSRKLPH